MEMNKQERMDSSKLGIYMPPYRPTYHFEGKFIDEAHQVYAACPAKQNTFIMIKNPRWFASTVKGWLRREDALKLYEMAYFSPGDILEIGMFNGLSTSILLTANQNAKVKKQITTVDLSAGNVRTSRRNLRAMRLMDHVTHICMDAVDYINQAVEQQAEFAFVFVDHSHTYQDNYNLCRKLHHVVPVGGFCLFHDYNDCRNSDPQDADYGVIQAVDDAFDESQWEFYGIYGCTGLYRRI